MPLSFKTQQLMEQMHNFVKGGHNDPIAGVDQQRMKHYRRLIRNVFDDTLRRAYPITVEVLPAKEWDDLVDAFILNDKPQTPFIWKMPFEFYEYVIKEDFAKKLDRPYLDDLLFFEWIEIDLFTMPDRPVPNFRPSGDFLKDRIIINPDHQILQLDYPVHKMPAEQSVKHRGQYFVLAFRTRHSGTVKFVDLTPLLAFIWQELNQHAVSGQALFQKIAQLNPNLSEDYLTLQVMPFFNDMLLQGALLGFLP